VNPAEIETARCKKCGGPLKQRADDNAAVVLERLKVYHRDTQPLIDYYGPRSTFRAVDGAQSFEQVEQDLKAAIEAALVNTNGGRR
jgi:adenylate kinase